MLILSKLSKWTLSTSLVVLIIFDLLLIVLSDNVTTTTITPISSTITTTKDPIIKNGSKHSSFLLLSSVSAIRYWSLDCPIHQSRPLWSLANDDLIGIATSSGSRYSYRQGISGMAIFINGTDHRLLWFDVPGHQLYMAKINRLEADDGDQSCDDKHFLTLENIRPIQLTGGVHNNNNRSSNGENFIELTIDSANGLIFQSNLLNHRIDVYRINQVATGPEDEYELKWVASITNTSHPKDIQTDSELKTLFWIESWRQICHVQYSSLETKLKKQCSGLFSSHPPMAMTLDLKHKRIIWADKSGHVWFADYQIQSDNDAIELFEHEDDVAGSVMGLEFIHQSDNSARLFIQDSHEIQQVVFVNVNQTLIKPTNQQPLETVLIEAQVVLQMLSVQFKNHERIPGPVDQIRSTAELNVNNDDLNDEDEMFDDRQWLQIFALLICLTFLIAFSMIIYLVVFRIFRNNQRDNCGDILNNCNTQTTPDDSFNQVSIVSSIKERLSSPVPNRHATTGSIRYQRLPKDGRSKLLSDMAKRSSWHRLLLANNHNQHRKAQQPQPDIEDLMKKRSNSGIVNPFLTDGKTCSNCPEPELCQGREFCMATFGAKLV